MSNEQKTIEELLIELDAADTQLSNEAARVIRELKKELAIAYLDIDILHETLGQLK